MLRIMEIDTEEKFNSVRAKEAATHDYLYILKYCNQIKMSDNGTLRNFTNIMICNSQEEFDNIEEKDNILYLVNCNTDVYRLYFSSILILESVVKNTDEEIDAAIDETIKELLQDLEESE